MDYGIFNVCTDVNACDCARVCTDTVRQTALKVDSGRKIPCRTGESNLRWWRAGPMLYQLSYTPTGYMQPRLYTVDYKQEIKPVPEMFKLILKQYNLAF